MPEPSSHTNSLWREAGSRTAECGPHYSDWCTQRQSYHTHTHTHTHMDTVDLEGRSREGEKDNIKRKKRRRLYLWKGEGSGLCNTVQSLTPRGWQRGVYGRALASAA